MRRRALFLLAAASVATAGCDDFEPAGTYAGDATVSSEVRTMTTDLQPDGSGTANTTSSNGSRQGVRVTVRRVGESRLEVHLDDGCVLPLAQDPEPNEHNAQVPFGDGDHPCPVALEGYRGPVSIGGTAQFGREDGSLDLSLSGSFQQGDPDRTGFVSGSWSYTFHGSRPSS